MVKNILITGGTGFIGSNLVKLLINNECNVYVLALKNDRKGIERIKSYGDVQIITDSIDDMCAQYQNYPTFDIIYHLASYGVDVRNNNIQLMCDVNIKMLGSLIDFCKVNQTKLLINTGSCFEYGDNSNIPLHEDMQCFPQSLYACSKQAAFIMMNTYAKQLSVPMVTVRPFGVYGINEAEFRLIPQVIKNGLEHKEMKLTAGEQIRDFLFVEDLVNILKDVGESAKIKLYDVYNICSGHPCTVREFVNEVIKVCGFDESLFLFGELPYRENESMYFSGDNHKLLSIIDTKIPVSHMLGIQKTLAWMKGAD